MEKIDKWVKRGSSEAKTTRLIRKGFVKEYFSPILKKLGYERIRFPSKERISFLSSDKLLCISFDLETGNDYANSERFVFVDFILMLPNLRNFPDKLKHLGFLRIKINDAIYWYRRLFVEYKSRRSTAEDAFNYISSIEREILEMLREYLL
ncbi:MAG: hypothetical protein QW303_00365 [Nitrososphaerota archaeon]